MSPSFPFFFAPTPLRWVLYSGCVWSQLGVACLGQATIGADFLSKDVLIDGHLLTLQIVSPPSWRVRVRFRSLVVSRRTGSTTRPHVPVLCSNRAHSLLVCQWDTAGQERFSTLIGTSFWRGAEVSDALLSLSLSLSLTLTHS
jgi:GTPase SAR1 family protein